MALRKLGSGRRRARTGSILSSGIPQVCILMETSRAFGRNVIRGICNYAKANGPWNFTLQPGDFDQSLPPRNTWRLDGVIGRISTPELAREVRARNIPVVPLEPGPYSGDRWVSTNTQHVCAMAFEHLRDRGFNRFAFYGRHTYWGIDRRDAFSAIVGQAGFTCEIFSVDAGSKIPEQAQLAAWLAKLTKPIGLMAQDDLAAREVIDLCRVDGIAVPEEIAVIGVDDDELICSIASPTLSSIALNAERVGFEAAAVLDRLFHGRKPQEHVFVDPIGVTMRQSTDTLSIDDPLVAKSVRLIRAHAHEGLTVRDLVKQVLVSRRTLELKFLRSVGRGPHEEIQRVQLQHAKELLIGTDMKISSVARTSGFNYVEYMHRVFKQQLDQTPTEFRKANRPFAH